MGFDLKTQRINKKGQVVAKQPYRLFIDGGIKKFERPPGSGNFFNEDGTEIAKKKVDAPKVEAKIEEKQIPQVQAPQAQPKTQQKQEPKAQPKSEMESLKADLLGEA